MRTLPILLWLGIGLGGCGGLPALVPLEPGPERTALVQRCQRLYPRAAFRAVHKIHAQLPMDQVSSVIGASLVDPDKVRLRAVLMSVEGLTLFDATAAGKDLTIHRAVPPLDDPDFGPGLMADVVLALLAPAGPATAVGGRADGRPACRHVQVDGGVVDLLPADGQHPQGIDRYDGDRDLVRRVVLVDPQGPLGLAARIELTAPGLVGYHLELTLIEAGPVTPEDGLFAP